MPLTIVWWCLTTASRNVRVRALLEQRDQRAQRLADVADQAEVDRGPATEVQRLVVDLDDRLSRRQERVVREVGARASAAGRTRPGPRWRHPSPADRSSRPRPGCRPPARPCRGRRTRSGPAGSRRAAAPRRARCGCPRRRGSRSSWPRRSAATAFSSASSLGRITGRSVSTGWPQHRRLDGLGRDVARAGSPCRRRAPGWPPAAPARRRAASGPAVEIRAT